MIRRSLFVIAVGLAAQSDPVPAELKLAIVTAHRDYLQADKDYQDAIKRINEVEQRRSGAKRRLDQGQDAANRLCGPSAAFDLDKLACVKIPGR